MFFTGKSHLAKKSGAFPMGHWVTTVIRWCAQVRWMCQTVVPSERRGAWRITSFTSPNRTIRPGPVTLRGPLGDP